MQTEQEKNLILSKFNRLEWHHDRMLIDDLVFRMMHHYSEDWTGGEHFLFYKIKDLVDQYADFFSRRSDFHPKRVIELGIYDGGSTAFWFELFQPQKHIAIDLMDRKDSDYFRRYLEMRGLKEQIKTFWKTDQEDKTRLQSIVEKEFDQPVDLIIDDASHLYRQTRASFETLFPMLEPKGLYIIEDWAWGHWPSYITPDHPWANEESLTRLVVELIEATGTSTQLISNIAVYLGFVAIERGPQHFEKGTDFRLDDHIVRRS